MHMGLELEYLQVTNVYSCKWGSEALSTFTEKKNQGVLREPSRTLPAGNCAASMDGHQGIGGGLV
jgi:hypothetical protein